MLCKEKKMKSFQQNRMAFIWFCFFSEIFLHSGCRSRNSCYNKANASKTEFVYKESIAMENIKLKGLVNTRTLSQYTNKEGKHIKPNETDSFL